jgi:hypothetical protein
MTLRNWECAVYLEQIKGVFVETLERFQRSSPMQRVLSRSIGIEHYKSFLRQIFHHTRENPQLQTLATAYFRGSQRAVIKRFFKHATSEIGHDQLALNDLSSLGVDTSSIPTENPLPATMALISFPFYQIQFHDPVGYLGYLFFLEYTPTTQGRSYMEALQLAGIPPEAMSFIKEHATVDVSHNKLMETYVSDLVKSDDQMQTMVYAMNVTGALYASMIQGAFDDADNPRNWGQSLMERKHAVR